MDPLPPELPPRAPLDEPDGRIHGGGGASLGTPFAETPDATGEPDPEICFIFSKIFLTHLNMCDPRPAVASAASGGVL